jgi:hypothetical protein
MLTQTSLQAQSSSTGKPNDNSYTILFKGILPPIKTNGDNQVSVDGSDSVKLVHGTYNESQMSKRLNINSRTTNGITVNKNDSVKIQPTHTIFLNKTPEGSWTKIHTSNGKKNEN